MLSLVVFLQISHEMEMQVRSCRHRGGISRSGMGDGWDPVCLH